MKPLLEIVAEYLEDHDIRFHRAEGSSTLHFGFALENVNITCIFEVDEESRYLSFCTRSGLKAAENRRAEMGEFVARANFGLRVGNFQFDYNDGEVLYKTSLFVGENEFDPDLLEPIIHANIQTYDRYYPGLVDVLYRDISPREAIDRLEGEFSNNEPEVSSEEIDAVLQRLFEDTADE